ncbi:putative serine/threonine-protein kinase ATM-like [Capsicum annuum]|nr:putative serine/threonine-protein kinase ATM-like [Capsicum annuum]
MCRHQGQLPRIPSLMLAEEEEDSTDKGNSGRKFFCLYNGNVLVYDVTSSDPSQIVALLPAHHKEDECYILESMGSLLVIVRYGVKLREPTTREDRYKFTLTPIDDDNDEIYGTTRFGVFVVDLAAGKLTETEELGDRALFLGANASISIQASQFPSLKPNHIYYTDDFWESYLGYEEGGSLDMGVYNLANGSFEPHYIGVSRSQVCPPNLDHSNSVDSYCF